jgi:hypothetical protein
MSVKPFEKLTPAGKRMRIARDVLAQLDAKKLIAERRTYVKPFENYEGWDSDLALSEYAKPCRVCALGSLLVCKVEYKNGFKLESLRTRRKITESLSDFFEQDQLNVIETAFEGYPEAGGYPADYEKNDCIYGQYRSLFETDEERLRDIMHNIIANRGVFVLKLEKTPPPKKSANQYTKSK